MSTYGIIYKTTNLINGKIYIGQTTNLDDKSYLGSGALITKAIKKYGKENFKRETLRECLNQKLLDTWEEIFIKTHNSTNLEVGYNLAQGSVFLKGTKSHTKLPEVRKKMSKNHANIKGENNPMYGKKHSEQTRRKISENSAKWMLGKTHTKESKRKISETTKGRIFSEETRRKMSEAAKGRTHSEETKIKMSENNTGSNHPLYGKKHSEETKRKISETKIRAKKFNNTAINE